MPRAHSKFHILFNWTKSKFSQKRSFIMLSTKNASRNWRFDSPQVLLSAWDQGEYPSPCQRQVFLRSKLLYDDLQIDIHGTIDLSGLARYAPKNYSANIFPLFNTLSTPKIARMAFYAQNERPSRSITNETVYFKTVIAPLVQKTIFTQIDGFTNKILKELSRTMWFFANMV